MINFMIRYKAITILGLSLSLAGTILLFFSVKKSPHKPPIAWEQKEPSYAELEEGKAKLGIALVAIGIVLQAIGVFFQ